MNDVLTLLRNHRSFRKYKKGIEIPEEKLDAIIRAAQAAPPRRGLTVNTIPLLRLKTKNVKIKWPSFAEINLT